MRKEVRDIILFLMDQNNFHLDNNFMYNTTRLIQMLFQEITRNIDNGVQELRVLQVDVERHGRTMRLQRLTAIFVVFSVFIYLFT